jgi:hypothetical protein
MIVLDKTRLFAITEEGFVVLDTCQLTAPSGCPSSFPTTTTTGSRDLLPPGSKVTDILLHPNQKLLYVALQQQHQILEISIHHWIVTRRFDMAYFPTKLALV